MKEDHSNNATKSHTTIKASIITFTTSSYN